MDKDKGFIDSYLKTHAKEFFPYSDAIWSFAELGCSEYKSSELL